MESSRAQELALIRIRLVADIASTAQCSKDEFSVVINLISELADMALEDGERELNDNK